MLAEVGTEVDFQISTEAEQEALAVIDQLLRVPETRTRFRVEVAPVGRADPLTLTRLSVPKLVVAKLGSE